MSKKKYSIFILFLLYSSFPMFSFAEGNLREIQFLKLKAKDKLKEAFSIAAKEIAVVQNPTNAEIWLFRFKETLRYRELMDCASEVLAKALHENPVFSDPNSAARAKLLLLDIYRRRGDLQKALQLSEELGIIREYRAIGPFHPMPLHELEALHDLEQSINFTNLYQGKNGKTGWFRIRADISGKIDFEDLFSEADESLFYIYTELSIPRDGKYCLHIGKNCPVIMRIDRKKIFSDLKSHGFEFDQFYISLNLKAGKHPLIIKASGTNEGCSLALRITDERGMPLSSISSESSLEKKVPEEIVVNYFKALENLYSMNDDNPWNFFRTGYLFYMSKLYSKERSEAFAFLKKAESNPLIAPYASFYSALCTSETVTKEHLLHKAIEKKDDYIEALAALSDIHIGNNLPYQAFPLTQKMQFFNPSSSLLYITRSNLWFLKGWHFEASKDVEQLLKGHYPSLGYQILGKLQQINGNYVLAAESYQKNYLSDRLDRSSLFSAAECLNNSGKFDDAQQILSMGTIFFPNDVELRLKIAETADKKNGPSASLPFLGSAYSLSPFNEKVLFALADAYHRLGKEDQARFYFLKAAESDEKNVHLQRYFSFIYGSDDYLKDHRVESDLHEMLAESEKYKSEPAVILLDETIYKISSDGSQEKRVRIIYKINSATAIKELSRQAVIISPVNETLERILCTVTNGSSRVETSETRIQSLSDPESRIYYDAIAHILSVPSLREGSIVEFSYVIKTKRADEYRNAYGFINILGGKNRVMRGNIIIDVPKDKPLKYKLQNTQSLSPKIEIRGERKIYRFLINNIEPIYEEPYMPHFSEILPMVAITSFYNWESLYRWYLSLLRGRYTANEAMLRDLRSIINPHDSPLEKVRKIYNFVTSRIRYVGFEFGIGSIRPRSAAETYASGMGDCKDIALLLVALLRSVGIDARIALVRTSDHGKIDMSIPWIGIFNHAICYVHLEGGFFLDGTASFSSFRELPENNHGVSALVMGDDGFRIIEVRNPIFEPNMILINNEVSIRTDGAARIIRHFIKRGGMFAPHARYSLNNSAGMMKNIAQYWNKAYPGSMVTDLKVIENNLDKPVEYSYQVFIPAFAQTVESGMAFKSIMVPSEEFQSFGQTKARKYALNLGAPRIIQEKTKFSLPYEYEPVKLPENKKFGNKFCYTEIFAKYSRSEHIIDFFYNSQWNVNNITVSGYEEFRNLLQFNSTAENDTIIIRKKIN